MGLNQLGSKKSIRNKQMTENKDLLGKIKSKYIIQIILSYIKNDKIKLKMFLHSKKYQILLYEYQYHYLIQKGINLFDYFGSFTNFYFDIKNQYENVLCNIDPKCLSKFIRNFPKTSKYKQGYWKIIDILSPMFVTFSKTGFLEEFTINIDMKKIREKKFNKRI